MKISNSHRVALGYTKLGSRNLAGFRLVRVEDLAGVGEVGAVGVVSGGVVVVVAVPGAVGATVLVAGRVGGVAGRSGDWCAIGRSTRRVRCKRLPLGSLM